MTGILRLIAGGLLALICCYIGMLIKRRYKAREQVYVSALSYSRALKSELSAKKTPIPRIADDFCAGRAGDFETALSECVKRMRSGNADLSDIVISPLKPAESAELLGHLKDFGGSTLEEQLALANRLETYALDRANTCKQETSRLGNMYFRLMVLLGLAIILILA